MSPDPNNPQIIERPELKKPVQAGVEWFVTAIAWALWAYFFMPLLTLLLWVAGLRFVLSEQLLHEGLRGLRSVAAALPLPLFFLL
mgnify:CR=1 FL=1